MANASALPPIRLFLSPCTAAYIMSPINRANNGGKGVLRPAFTNTQASRSQTLIADAARLALEAKPEPDDRSRNIQARSKGA